MTGRVAISGAPVMWRLGEGAAPTGPHVVLVPGAEAPVLPITLPSGVQGAAREQVALRQLSEALSLPADTFEMHPITPKGAKTWNRVILIERDRADAWRKTAGRGALAMLPDFMGLPTAPGLWTVEVREGRVTVRSAPDDGFSAEPALAAAQLARADMPKAILRLGEPEAEVDQVITALGVPVARDAAGLKQAGLSPLRWGDSLGGVNLIAPPSAAVDRIRQGLRRWRPGAIAAAIALAAWIGTLWLDTQAARDRAELAEARVQALVREHFVAQGPILDVRAQVGQALEAALEPDVIELPSVPALTQFQIAAKTLTREGARVLSVDYQPETGLETSVATDSFAVLDEIVIGLQNADFLVEQLDSRSDQAGGVVSRLRLELFE